VLGNEGACSADFSSLTAGTGSTNQIGFAAPAASTGAVGYTVYISLASGTYVLAYQVPLSSSVCTLTKVETITPACAVTNATYGQTGSNAVVSALTVNTAPIALQLGSASTTSGYVGNSNSHTTYGYSPSTKPAIPGMVSSGMAFTAGPATVATTVPQVIGTIALPAGYFNYVGRGFRVCGKHELTSNASGTSEQIEFLLDSAGSDTAGVPVIIGILSGTATGTAVAYNGEFCEQFTVTAAGTSTTAGSIQGGDSHVNLCIASAPASSTCFSGVDTKTATTTSINLAGTAGYTSRLHIVQLHTGGTDVSPQLMNYSFELLN
jgi:hypothetical protein